MKAILDKTSSLYEIVEGHELQLSTFGWDELANFNGALIELEKATRSVQPPRSVESFLRECRQVRRILRASPLPPPYLATTFEAILSFDLTHIAGSHLSALVEHLINCAHAVWGSDNPFTVPTADLIATDVGIEYADGTIGPDIALIVVADAIEFVNAWLQEEELAAEVVPVRLAQNSIAWEIGLLFGSPELHVFSRDQEQAAGAASWLISAPPARNFNIFLGPGSRSFHFKNYQLWDGMHYTQATATITNAPKRFEVDIVPDWIPTVPTVREGFLQNNLVDVVEAMPVLLGDDYWVFYARREDIGAMPMLLLWQGEEVTVRKAHYRELSVGSVIVVRSERASRDFLVATAQQWIDERHGDGVAHRDFKVLEQFRAGVQALSQRPDATARLTRAGMAEDYARYRLRASWDEAVIATQKEIDFRILAREVGMSDLEDAWKSLKRIQTAMRKAGMIATGELVEQLKTSSDWQVYVESGSLCALTLENVGEMTIGAIRALPQESQQMSISQLGTLINATGETYEEDYVL